MLKKFLHYFFLTCSVLFSIFPVISEAAVIDKNKCLGDYENIIFSNAAQPDFADPVVRLEAYNINRDEFTNTVSPWFRLYNMGTSDLNLSEVKIRYYYTYEGEAEENFWCDWSNIGSSNINYSFNRMQTPVTYADSYLEIGFKSGTRSVKPGEYVEIQSRFAKSDWSSHVQVNDYSFNSTSDGFIDWDKVTVYVNNMLAWGAEPQNPSPSPIPVKKIEIKMHNTEAQNYTNTLYPRYIIKNTGNVPINLQDVRIRYYYTIDGEKKQNFWCDWSNIGSSNVTGNFVKLPEEIEKADYYLEIGFKPGAGVIYPGSEVEMHIRIAKSDWTNYIQSNDYSYTGSKHNYILWDKVTAFICDEMVWGDQTLLGKPFILTAESQENAVFLSWTPVEGATGYDVSDNGTVVNSVYCNSFNHTGLTAGTCHQYRVRATSSTLTGSWSDICSIWTLPDVPVNIVTEATENVINIKWAQVTGATGYDIEADGILYENVESPFVHTALQPGILHQYRIRAKNSSGYGKWIDKFNKWTIPDKVAEVNAYANQTVIVLYWESVTGATAYDIEFDGDILEEIFPTVSIIDLEPGTLHKYRVRGKNASGAGAWSEEYSYWTVPGIVTNITGHATQTQIDIVWSDISGASGYDIEVDGEIIDNQSSPFIYTDLDEGTRHFFRIRAKNSSGIGFWNEALEVWTLPGLVEGIETQGLQDKIIIQWEPVRGAASYEIKEGDDIYETVSSPFIHDGLTPGTLYKYLIRAKNSSGSGVWSNEAERWTLPDKVTEATLDATETEIRVSWEEVTGAAGYDIEIDEDLYEDVTSPYIHQNLLEGTKHVYKLRAKNSSGCGFWNDEIEKWTIPPVPVNISIFSGEYFLIMSWDETTGATGYDLRIDGVSHENVTNPYNIQGLEPGTEYTIEVRAKNDSGSGKWSDSINVRTIPGIIEQFEIKAEQTNIHLQWESVKGADGYDIKIDEQLLTDIESPFLYQGVNPGTEHCIQIRAKNSAGIGRWSEIQTIWTLPDIPKNIITQPASDSVKILWDPVTGATGYDIEIYGTAVDTGGEEWYTHNGLNSNNQQTYRVRGKNSSGAGDWSPYMAVTTLTAIPSILRTEADDRKIVVYWDPIPGALDYDIEVDGITINIPEPVYEHKDLQPGTIHTYRVRSNGAGGPSDWTNIAVSSTLLSPPEITEINLTTTQIQLSWHDAVGADGYDIEVDGLIYNNGNKTNFLHAELEPDSEHIYRIRAKSGLVEGIWSQPIIKSTLLQAPENILGESSDKYIILRWEMVTEATSYDIEADGQIISNGLSTQFQHAGLEAFSVHTYRIRVWNREGAGEWSEPVTLYTLVGAPSDIYTISTSSEITIQWDEVPNATGYDIMVDGNIYDNGDSTCYKHTGIEPNSLHFYQVRSKGNTVPGKWSGVISARAMAGIPASLECFPKSREIIIVWDEVEGATNYDLEINGEIVANITDNFYTQTGLDPNSVYTVKARANNELGSSEWSNFIESTTAPDIPVGISVTETTSEIKLEWEPVEGTVSYDVEADGIITSDIIDPCYTHSGLKSNSRHIYRIRSKNEHTPSEWSDIITRLTTPEIAVPTQKDVIFNFVIVSPQRTGQNECHIVVTYNPEELEVFDLCALTPQPETQAGEISGTDITIAEFSPGRIVYTIENADRTVVQIIKFLSNISGHSKVTYTIQ